jgi:endonuclease I
VDLQRDKMVRSIYSEKEYDPASFIREDFDIERRHEARLRERRTLEADVSDESLARFLAELEAAEPFNCEHVVPQSWFGKAFPMQGDLHHLYSCESNCNSFRGNNPYADHGRFDPRDERVRAECGDLTDGAFEPFRGKGKVARATLYFLLRYPGRSNQTGDAYTPQQIETLVRWHEDVAVTEHELHRNQAIFEIQGTRNPFIDHPQWARRVFGA